MVFFSEDYAEIHWDDVNRIVIVIYKGDITSEQLHSIFKKTIECGVINGGTKYLVDSRKFTTIKPEDQNWITTVWAPEALKGGMKKVALVLPEDVLQKQVLSNLSDEGSNKKNSGFRSETFDSIIAAIAWLKI